MSSDPIRALCAELLKALVLFVDSDGDSSYISDDEKEAQVHVKDARALITAARAALKDAAPLAEVERWLRDCSALQEVGK